MTIYCSTDHLIRPFAILVQGIEAELRAKRLNPRIAETWRNDARQTELQAQGHSKVASRGMHFFGVAVDIVDARLGWGAEPHFWSALGRAAHARGLTWGGDWEFVDKAHIQYLPVDWPGAGTTLDKLRGIVRGPFSTGQPSTPQKFFAAAVVREKLMPMVSLMRLYDLADQNKTSVLGAEELRAIANILRPKLPC
jgi:hypothetical protein